MFVPPSQTTRLQGATTVGDRWPPNESLFDGSWGVKKKKKKKKQCEREALFGWSGILSGTSKGGVLRPSKLKLVTCNAVSDKYDDCKTAIVHGHLRPVQKKGANNKRRMQVEVEQLMVG